MGSVVDRLRDIADDLEKAEKNYGLECNCMRGIACIKSESLSFTDESLNGNKILWDNIKEDDYGFIGIMPNQWRPEIHIKAMIEGIRVPLYNFSPNSYHTFNGGFLDKFDSIMEDIKLAPKHIKDRVEELRDYCVEQINEDDLKKELEDLEIRKLEIEGKLR